MTCMQRVPIEKRKRDTIYLILSLLALLGWTMVGCDLTGTLPDVNDPNADEDGQVLSSHPDDPSDENSSPDDLADEPTDSDPAPVDDGTGEVDEAGTTNGPTEEPLPDPVDPPEPVEDPVAGEDPAPSPGGGGGGSSGGGGGGGGSSEPPAPDTLDIEVTQTSDRQFMVNWTPGSSTYASYGVRRYASSGQWELLDVAGTGDRQYLDTSADGELAACYSVVGLNSATDYEESPAVCAANPAVLSPTQAPVTLHVTNEAELKTASHQSAFGDSEILIYGQVEIEGDLQFSSGNLTVHMRGATADAGIVFTKRWDGDWNSPEAVGKNGLTFTGRHAVIEDLTFSGYEWRGSALKSHTSESFVVRDCHFSDIATLIYPPKSVPVVNSDQVWYGNVIGGGSHGGALADIWINSCSFQRCALNSNYGHVIYVWGNTASITNSTFQESGSPNQFTSTAPVNGVAFLANTFTNQRQVPRRNGDPEDMPLMMYPNGPAVFAFNTVIGERYYIAHHAFQGPGLHRADHNDYSAMNYTLTWAVQGSDWIDPDYWTNTLQLDQNSAMPD